MQSQSHLSLFDLANVNIYFFYLKTLETYFLRQYLDVLSVILRIFDNDVNLQPVFNAIATRMRSVSFYVMTI